MSDIFASEKMKELHSKITEALKKVGGTLKLRVFMLPAEAGGPTPEPQNLISILASQRVMLFELQREVLLLTSVVKTLVLGIREEDEESILTHIEEIVDAKLKILLKNVEVTPKSKILLPDGSPAPSNN